MMCKKYKKVIIGTMIFLVIIASIISLVVINSNKKNDEDNLYSLSELDFLKTVDTNSIFTTLKENVNSELIGVYAFSIVENKFDNTYDIVALKMDNTIVKLTTIQEWAYNFEYSNGILYYQQEYFDTWYINLNEGNGKYNMKHYKYSDSDLTVIAEKLTIDDITFDYEYTMDPTFFIEYQNKRYDLKNNDYRPITLLPNNYLIVEHYTDKTVFSKREYINLKTGKKDDDYFSKYNQYYDNNHFYFAIQ